MTSDSKDELKNTLAKVGVKDIARYKIEIIDHSRPFIGENTRLYRKANKLFLSEIEKSTQTKIVHVTGEMRAIIDPLHRKVCKANWEKNKLPTVVIAYLPNQYSPDPRCIIDYDKSAWRGSNWFDILDALDCIGNGVFEIYISPFLETVHYSTQSDSLVLLQGEHPHHQANKWVWILRSQDLTEHMNNRSSSILSKSERVSARDFIDYTYSLSSELALHILFTIKTLKQIKRMDLEKQLHGFESYDDTCLTNLVNIGFLQEDGGLINLSAVGKRYLNMFL